MGKYILIAPKLGEKLPFGLAPFLVLSNTKNLKILGEFYDKNSANEFINRLKKNRGSFI